MYGDPEPPPEAEKLERPSVPALDAILGHQFRVLDDGFVRLVDYMGSDSSIVQAARVSYGKGTKQLHEDRGLVRYLMRHAHTTPFEMCELKLHVRVPMDCWRQWIRHRTASVNEYSTRYSLAIDASQHTLPSEWRAQSTANRQGSGDLLPSSAGRSLTEREEAFHKLAREMYEERVVAGVAREQARKDLPLSTYTEAYWKIDLHNLLHFLRLRLDPHAQLEIRSYATVIAEQIVARWCPLTWDAFRDYELHGTRLTDLELRLIKELVADRPDEAIHLAKNAGLLPDGMTPLPPNRERAEIEDKLALLGLAIPWTDGRK